MRLTCCSCDTTFERRQRNTSGNVFCSRSCAARYNNVKFPKRKLTRMCKMCKTLVRSEATYCSKSCQESSRLRKKLANIYLCKWHLCQNYSHLLFCSTPCKNKHNVCLKRVRFKKKAVAYKGGKCLKCGYSRCSAAFDFHHRDPTQKDFPLTKGASMSWSKAQQELDKCDLLCATCHREVHYMEE